MKQYLKLKLSQKLSPQQIQLMKLIQLPTLDFEQKIQREIEENPALEESNNLDDNIQEDDYSNDNDLNIDDYLNEDDTPYYKLNSNNSNRTEEKHIPFSSGISFTEHLTSQLKPMSLDNKKMIWLVTNFLNIMGPANALYYFLHPIILVWCGGFGNYIFRRKRKEWFYF